MVPVAVGAAAGASVALIGGRALASLVYGVETGDAATLLAAVLGFVLIALAAILIATRGAARTDPSVALRAD
jgi:hypothetical protein